MSEKLYRKTGEKVQATPVHRFILVDEYVEVEPDYEAMVRWFDEHNWRHLTVREAQGLWAAALDAEAVSDE